MQTPEGPSIIESIERFEAEGYRAQFVPQADGSGVKVRCVSCGAILPPTALIAHQQARTEGESDPDEEAIVISVGCPRCDALGTLTLSYGPEASALDSEILAALGDIVGGAG